MTIRKLKRNSGTRDLRPVNISNYLFYKKFKHVNDINSDGFTPLMRAIFDNEGVDHLDELIKQGAYLNARCTRPSSRFYNYTPLAIALKIGRNRDYNYLINKDNIELNNIDNDNRSAFDFLIGVSSYALAYDIARNRDVDFIKNKNRNIKIMQGDLRRFYVNFTDYMEHLELNKPVDFRSSTDEYSSSLRHVCNCLSLFFSDAKISKLINYVHNHVIKNRCEQVISNI